MLMPTHQETVYRRTIGSSSNVWHWHRNCHRWPATESSEIRSFARRPTPACARCSELERQHPQSLADIGQGLLESCCAHILIAMRTFPDEGSHGITQSEVMRHTGLEVLVPDGERPMKGWFIRALLFHLVATNRIRSTGKGGNRKYYPM